MKAILRQYGIITNDVFLIDKPVMDDCNAKQVVLKDLQDTESIQVCDGKVEKQRSAKLIDEDGRIIPVTLYENTQGVVAITDKYGILPLQSDTECRLSELRDNDTFSILEVLVKDNLLNDQ